MSKVEVEKVKTLTGHRDAIYCLEAGLDAGQFFSAAGDGMIVQWDLAHPDEGELIAKLPNSIYALHRLENDLLVAGHNYDGIHLLNWRNKKEEASLHLGAAALFDIKSFDGFIIVVDGEGVIYKISQQRWRVEAKIRASEKSARCLAINHKRGELAVGFSDNFIRIYDLTNLSLKQEWHAHTNSVFTLSYSPNHHYLISGSRDARLKAWDAESHYALAHEVVAHLFAINHIAFSPDQKHFVTCSMDKSIKVWDAAEMKLLKVIDKARHAGHGTSVNKLLWTPFFDQLVSASDDRTLSVWKLFFKLHTNQS